MLRPTPSAWLLLAAPFAALPASASDLNLDGQTQIQAALGSSLTIELLGNPGLPGFVSFDVDPGPVNIAGDLVPLGLTPALTPVLIGNTDGAGLLSTTLGLPSDPALTGVTLYFAGVVIDPADANGLDFSGGAELTFVAANQEPVALDLVGVVRPGAPFFDWITVVPEGDSVRVGLDTAALPTLVGQNGRAYVTADRTAAEWAGNAVLTDLSGNGAELLAFSAGGVAANTFVVDVGQLGGNGGANLGVGYDLVIDLDGDGLLGSGDLIDGLDGAGFYVVRDPSLPGPYPVTEITYSGGSFLGQVLFYPSNVAELSSLPLVVVSHGNGHNYLWYDHIGNHLASYGYVVMSHQNNTVPGVASAATTTLTNTDFLLGNLATIAGGVLNGKLDSSRITWIGHSRGGEGIAIAYDRLIDGAFVPVNYSAADIVLLSSIAPTAFMSKVTTDPHAVDFHLWVGAADADVSGCAQSDVTQSFQLFGRAEDQRQSICLYGVGHAWFHNGGGSAVATGPCLLNQALTHNIVRGHLLPLVEYHVRGNRAGLDYLWRSYEDLHPPSVSLANPCVVVNQQFRADASERYVIEDFQSQPDPLVASSGALITADFPNYATNILQASNNAFTYNAGDPFTGTTYAQNAGFERAGAVDFSGTDASLSFDLAPAGQDWTGYAVLSLRAARATRHPSIPGNPGDAHFEIRVVDAQGDAATVSTADLGNGLRAPYARTGCGTGTGWASEFETVRVSLQALRAIQPALDLDAMDRVELLFGPSHGEPSARLTFDDLELSTR